MQPEICLRASGCILCCVEKNWQCKDRFIRLTKEIWTVHCYVVNREWWNFDKKITKPLEKGCILLDSMLQY